MATKLIVLATSGDNREDGNIYYSRYIMVSSDTLTFDEALFTDDEHPLLAQDAPEDGDRYEMLIGAIRALGYSVEEPEVKYLEIEAG